MKKLFLVALMLMLATSVFASVAVEDDGTYSGDAAKISFNGVGTSFDGDTMTVNCADLETDITIASGSTLAVSDLTSSGTAGLIELLGESLTHSGTSLYWAGKALTN